MAVIHPHFYAYRFMYGRFSIEQITNACSTYIATHCVRLIDAVKQVNSKHTRAVLFLVEQYSRHYWNLFNI